jgi:hypothetical protein
MVLCRHNPGTSMTKYCNVAPMNIQTALWEHGILGSNHLLLAHDVAENVDKYKFFEARLHRGLVIMDNSAYELKKAVNSDMVWKAVLAAKPTCVVLPDVYLNGPKTLAGVKEVLADWHVRRTLSGCKLHFMVIPQGANDEEWAWCCEEMAFIEHIEWWGIPRNFREVFGMSRRFAVNLAHALCPRRMIHLFGMSNDYINDMVATQDPRVSSIDSTTPIRAGSLGIPFRLTGMKLPSRGGWWDTAQWNDQIIYNLEYARELF